MKGEGKLFARIADGKSLHDVFLFPGVISALRQQL